MRQRLTPKDLEVTEAERRAARVAGEGGEGARNIGSSIGSVAGGALGALGFLGGPAVGAATLGIGSSLGGALGSEIGGATAQGDVDDANRVLTEAERKRQEKIALYQLRQDALEALMNED
jgi:hypothetical protein